MVDNNIIEHHQRADNYKLYFSKKATLRWLLQSSGEQDRTADLRVMNPTL